MGEFDLAGLYSALDARRQQLGLTWTGAAREISVGSVPDRRISASTVTTLRSKKLAEGDGVLQMLRWLGRTPESFVEGFSPRSGESYELPASAPRQVLRFDTAKLHTHLNAERQSRQLTWKQMESETQVPASHIKGLARGGRTAFPPVMRLTLWLAKPAAHFVRTSRF